MPQNSRVEMPHHQEPFRDWSSVLFNNCRSIDIMKILPKICLGILCFGLIVFSYLMFLQDSMFNINSVNFYGTQNWISIMHWLNIYQGISYIIILIGGIGFVATLIPLHDEKPKQFEKEVAPFTLRPKGRSSSGS